MTFEQDGDTSPIDARLLTGADGLPSRTVGDALLALITLRYTQSNSIAGVQDGMTLGSAPANRTGWIASRWRWPRRGCGGCGATGMSGSFLREDLVLLMQEEAIGLPSDSARTARAGARAWRRSTAKPYSATLPTRGCSTSRSPACRPRQRRGLAGRRAPGAGGSTVDAPGAGAGGAAGDRPGALGRHRAGRLCPVQRETGLNDAEAAAREDALFRLLVTADAYPHLLAAVDAGVFLAKVTRSGSGWPAAWTESLPTSSPPGVATTTNRTRGRGWMTPGSPKTAAPGRPRRPSPPPRRRCATRADSSGSPPARSGRGCVARARVESTTGGCVHFLPYIGLGRRICRPGWLSGRKWRMASAVADHTHRRCPHRA